MAAPTCAETMPSITSAVGGTLRAPSERRAEMERPWANVTRTFLKEGADSLAPA
jgi:hypothetical protein